jgi:hypothetical protein
VTQLLTRHTLADCSFTSSSLSALTSPLPTVQGAALYIDFVRGVYSNYLYANGCRARVMDLLATNGVIHVLECVPQPNFQPPLRQ